MGECALDPCCRKGELLSLQWWESPSTVTRFFYPARKTKRGKLRAHDSGDRWIPMTQRVRGWLDMGRLVKDGKDRKPTDYVVGDAAGEQIASITTAWKLACRRAGIVGLLFHDQRREGASSLLESRMAIAASLTRRISVCIATTLSRQVRRDHSGFMRNGAGSVKHSVVAKDSTISMPVAYAPLSDHHDNALRRTVTARGVARA
jgi:hypothetical protein